MELSFPGAKVLESKVPITLYSASTPLNLT